MNLAVYVAGTDFGTAAGGGATSTGAGPGAGALR